jgi:hypothetical protein
MHWDPGTAQPIPNDRLCHATMLNAPTKGTPAPGQYRAESDQCSFEVRAVLPGQGLWQRMAPPKPSISLIHPHSPAKEETKSPAFTLPTTHRPPRVPPIPIPISTPQPMRTITQLNRITVTISMEAPATSLVLRMDRDSCTLPLGLLYRPWRAIRNQWLLRCPWRFFPITSLLKTGRRLKVARLLDHRAGNTYRHKPT